MRRLPLLLWAAGAALGLGAEWASYGWDDPRHWIPDLAVGWTLIACGLVASSRRPESRTGALMAATGFAWFAGNFSQAGWGPLAWLAEQTTFLYLGVLIHCVVSYPSGRLASRRDRAVVAAGYVLALAVAPLAHDAGTIALGAVLVGAGIDRYVATRGPARRACLPAVEAAVLTGAVLATGSALRLLLPPGQGDEAVLLSEQAALLAASVLLVTGLLRRPAEGAAVADLVVELGEARSGTLRDGLAQVLGDPTLEVAYWSPRAGAYVDASGRKLALPAHGTGRSVTTVERDGAPVAVLVHDSAVLDDPALVEAVASAARLAAVNARLQAEVRAQVSEVRSSRRRLVEVADEERRRLESRLREGAERRLLGVSRTLTQIEAASQRPVGAESFERIARAGRQLGRTLEELHELARGLHPRVLAEEGLSGALRSLADQNPAPVEVSVAVEGVPREVEATLYFACAEVLANVAKYAAASRVTLAVSSRDGTVQLDVADDGVGGASLTGGTGLRSLTDRVEALGGRLRLDSPAGQGTRLVAEIPLSAEAVAAWPRESG